MAYYWDAPPVGDTHAGAAVRALLRVDDVPGDLPLGSRSAKRRRLEAATASPSLPVADAVGSHSASVENSSLPSAAGKLADSSAFATGEESFSANDDGKLVLSNVTDEERIALATAVDGPPGADGSTSAARTLYIGNVAASASALLLYELASRCGPVRHVRLPGHASVPGNAAPTPTRTGFAFIEFEHEVSVHYAMRALTGLSLCGLQLRAAQRTVVVGGDAGDDAKDDDGGGGPAAQLYLRPLPEGVDEWDLWDLGALAGGAGSVASVRMPRDAFGRTRGYGFISYRRSAEVMQRALQVLAAGLCSLASRAVSVTLSDASAAAMAAAAAASATRGEAALADRSLPQSSPHSLARVLEPVQQAPPEPRAAPFVSLGGGAPVLPLDDTVQAGLIIEALQAHCRRIERRLAETVAKTAAPNEAM